MPYRTPPPFPTRPKPSFFDRIGCKLGAHELKAEPVSDLNLPLELITDETVRIFCSKCYNRFSAQGLSIMQFVEVYVSLKEQGCLPDD